MEMISGARIDTTRLGQSPARDTRRRRCINHRPWGHALAYTDAFRVRRVEPIYVRATAGLVRHESDLRVRRSLRGRSVAVGGCDRNP